MLTGYREPPIVWSAGGLLSRLDPAGTLRGRRAGEQAHPGAAPEAVPAFSAGVWGAGLWRPGAGNSYQKCSRLMTRQPAKEPA